jgi:hypothetical protein
MISGQFPKKLYLERKLFQDKKTRAAAGPGNYAIELSAWLQSLISSGVLDVSTANITTGVLAPATNNRVADFAGQTLSMKGTANKTISTGVVGGTVSKVEVLTTGVTLSADQKSELTLNESGVLGLTGKNGSDADFAVYSTNTNNIDSISIDAVKGSTIARLRLLDTGSVIFNSTSQIYRLGDIAANTPLSIADSVATTKFSKLSIDGDTGFLYKAVGTFVFVSDTALVTSNGTLASTGSPTASEMQSWVNDAAAFASSLNSYRERFIRYNGTDVSSTETTHLFYVDENHVVESVKSPSEDSANITRGTLLAATANRTVVIGNNELSFTTDDGTNDSSIGLTPSQSELRSTNAVENSIIRATAESVVLYQSNADYVIGTNAGSAVNPTAANSDEPRLLTIDNNYKVLSVPTMVFINSTGFANPLKATPAEVNGSLSNKLQKGYITGTSAYGDAAVQIWEKDFAGTIRLVTDNNIIPNITQGTLVTATSSRTVPMGTSNLIINGTGNKIISHTDVTGDIVTDLIISDSGSLIVNNDNVVNGFNVATTGLSMYVANAASNIGLAINGDFSVKSATNKYSFDSGKLPTEYDITGFASDLLSINPDTGRIYTINTEAIHTSSSNVNANDINNPTLAEVASFIGTFETAQNKRFTHRLFYYTGTNNGTDTPTHVYQRDGNGKLILLKEPTSDTSITTGTLAAPSGDRTVAMGTHALTIDGAGYKTIISDTASVDNKLYVGATVSLTHSTSGFESGFFSTQSLTKMTTKNNLSGIQITLSGDIAFKSNTNKYSFDANKLPTVYAGTALNKALSMDSTGRIYATPDVPKYSTGTGAQTLTPDANVHNVPSGTDDVTLFSAAGIAGKQITVKNSGSGSVDVITDGSETIDGSTSNITLGTQYDAITLMSDGTNWLVVSKYSA